MLVGTYILKRAEFCRILIQCTLKNPKSVVIVEENLPLRFWSTTAAPNPSGTKYLIWTIAYGSYDMDVQTNF